ncbi:MAG: LysR family transcriptional regulator [Burkholderiaceae bacterium]
MTLRGHEFTELQAFVEISRTGSFSKAAMALRLSRPTLSQRIRSLEERVGARLFRRTTRSVSLTTAGEQLLARVEPALDELRRAMEDASADAGQPVGDLRLYVSPLAAHIALMPRLEELKAACPHIRIEIEVGHALIDLAEHRFDAGVRSGHYIAKNMISVPVSAPSRFIAAASPDYLARRGTPQSPAELHRHNCVLLRQISGELLPWRFVQGENELAVPVDGDFITNDVALMLAASKQGLGICYSLEEHLAPAFARGELVPLLGSYGRRFSGFAVYFPSRRQMLPALRAFIDFLKKGCAGKQADLDGEPAPARQP